MSDFATPWTVACQSPLSSTLSQSFIKFMSIELVMLSNHLILCYLLLPVPSVFPSISIFSNELAFPIRWPKHWSFSFRISPSNGYSGLISFRIDWFDLLAVQGTLQNLLQPKTSILQHSAFFMVQLSYLYMTTGKTNPSLVSSVLLSMTYLGNPLGTSCNILRCQQCRVTF